MTTITIEIASNGWQATFRHSNDMPNNVALPFTATAPAETVRIDLRKRFPTAAIITKASSR